jgi:hypothetical protein
MIDETFITDFLYALFLYLYNIFLGFGLSLPF